MSIPVLATLPEMAENYRFFLVDIWGVLHDGHAPIAGAIDALQWLRAADKPVLLLSNAPRPSDSVAQRLYEIGFPRDLWHGIVTSGDVTRHALQNHRNARVLHLGPIRDIGIFEDTGVEMVENIADADMLVCTGLVDDGMEMTESRRVLDLAIHRGLPMICANPDRVVSIGGRAVPCAGAVADCYHAMGGEITWHGKPFPSIYHRALEILGLSAKQSPQLACIGDSLETDIKGASSIGMDAIFVASGIHADDYKSNGAALFTGLGFTPPRWVMPRFGHFAKS